MSGLALYLAVSIANVMTPGPGVIFTTTSALKYGIRTSYTCAFGNAIGTAMMATAAAAGVGALLSAYPGLFLFLQCFGIAYLLYLGIKNLRSAARAGKNTGPFSENRESAGESSFTLFREALLLQLSNPLLIFFLVALFPQFIEPEEAFWPQVAVLTAIFMLTVIVIHLGYGAIATYARRYLMGPTASVWIRRVSGALFIAIACAVFANMLPNLTQTLFAA